MPLEDVQISELRTRMLIFLRLLTEFVDTGQSSAKSTKERILGELHDPFYNTLTIVLTIMVAGWDVRLLSDNLFQSSLNYHKIS